MKSIVFKTKAAFFKGKFATLLVVVLTGGALLACGSALADSLTNSTSTAARKPTGSKSAASQQADLLNIKSKGDQAIERRIATLDNLTTKINAATKLTVSVKSNLIDEVSSTNSGLTSLKAQLNSETTISAAIVDAKNIYSEYRVYALVAPRVGLISIANDQQVAQGKLDALAQKLQTSITAEQKAGKNVATIQGQLSNMQTKTSAAQTISDNAESSLVTLQPSDYNTNHAILSGYNAQLKNAHSDDQTAIADAKNIVSTIKTM
jgi:hypothetical protein